MIRYVLVRDVLTVPAAASGPTLTSGSCSIIDAHAPLFYLLLLHQFDLERKLIKSNSMEEHLRINQQ